MCVWETILVPLRVEFGVFFLIARVTCALPPQIGHCRAMFVMFFFNSTSRRCESFVYGGCGGNGNKFETKEECSSACGNCFKHLKAICYSRYVYLE